MMTLLLVFLLRTWATEPSPAPAAVAFTPALTMSEAPRRGGISLVVGPLMLAEVGGALVWAVDTGGLVSNRESLAGLVLLGVAWGATGLFSVPQHARLERGRRVDVGVAAARRLGELARHGAHRERVGAVVEIAEHRELGATVTQQPRLHARPELQRLRPACRWLVITGEVEAGILPGLHRALERSGLPWESLHDLDLTSLAQRLRPCRAFFGHDSGISHLAAACGVPCHLLFGPTDPAIWAPEGATMPPCRAPKGDWQQLTPAAVLEWATVSHSAFMSYSAKIQ
jgi:hypothetical protein